jgi:hypothetical protein
MPTKGSEIERFLQQISADLRAHKRKMREKYGFNFEKGEPDTKAPYCKLVWKKVDCKREEKQ